ncbi:MAG: arginine--tRNA ligase [Cytophagales bacterium]|nr:arginine--tRNA ligase [Cytophagales bacterium]MDW8383269.1 arginine--tRNA ligase [Flammeovirgaceae bacterium]
MNIELQLASDISNAFQLLFGLSLEASAIQLQPTRKEFEGNLTFIVFPYVKQTHKKPEELGELIGNYLINHTSYVSKYQVIKGFLNLTLQTKSWIQIFSEGIDFKFAKRSEKVMVEYSSPNTNKPLHLGHLRNNFLGWSISQILKEVGYEVMMVNLVNDRGIHICKSMLAYQKFGNGEKPSSTLKGDHLVGKYYVMFDKWYKEQVKEIAAKHRQENPSLSEEQAEELAEKEAPAILQAQEMLRKWEEGDPEIVALWKQMNSWVYEGFEATYRKIGVHFDKIYYESDTYLLGKDLVQEGLEKGIFYRKSDGSVWVDLTAEGLDHKLLLRSDGTSVYITQDLGTADMRYQDFPMNKLIYVVGNEQEYHFKVLKLILQKLGRPYAEGLYHLSYGMVELPEGKMKSREGTVVDADDLIEEMIETARERTLALGKIEGFTEEELQKLYHVLAMGALKYYLLRVEPSKKMLFNPKESIDFQGNTGVYIQYTYAKIASILRKAKAENISLSFTELQDFSDIEPIEQQLISAIVRYKQKVEEAAQEYAPSIIANHAYETAKTYNTFYNTFSILGESHPLKKQFRVILSYYVAEVLKRSFRLLGIEMPERM